MPRSLHSAMGIKGLTKLLRDNAWKAVKERKLQSYFGRKIAIDASMSIYQFLVFFFAAFSFTIRFAFQIIKLSNFHLPLIAFFLLVEIVVGRAGIQTLTNEAREVTRYVFDGTPPDLKKQELAKRFSRKEGAVDDLAVAKETGVKEDIEKYSKRTVIVTKQHDENCKRLLRLMSVPVMEALSEAEAECASLCKSGKVYAAASEDMDSLTFGAPRFLRHLFYPSSRKVPVMEFEISKILEELYGPVH